MSVFERLSAKLAAAGVPFAVSHHAPVFTSEEAAAVRGAPLSSGAKAIVYKADDAFVMLVVPADRKLDGKKVKKALRAKSTRFADAAEVETLTALKPGSIPPFGSLFGLATYVDPSLSQNDRINFNAGDHAISINIAHADYVLAEQPTPLDIT